MMTSSHPCETAPAGPLPSRCGSLPLPAPGPMRLDDGLALLDAVTVRLQRLVDGGHIASPDGAGSGAGPLQECIDALRQLRRNLRASDR